MNRVNRIVLAVFAALLIIYAFWYEPNNLEVTRHVLSYGNTGKILKIAHITDLHTSGLGRLEANLIDHLSKEHPDVILISGDIATPNGTMSGYLEVLRKIKAPLGIYFVSGNWEYWTPIEDQSSLLKNSHIENIENRAIHLKDNIWILGFEDELEGQPDLSLMDQFPNDAIKIAMFHSPSFFKQVHDIDLSLSGHSHEGQVRLPFIGALWVPDGTDKFDMGWFGKGNSKMYVSKGIGTSILPVRFLCRPELAMFNIKY